MTRTMESFARVARWPYTGSPPKSTNSLITSSMSAREPSGLPNGPTGSSRRRLLLIFTPKPDRSPSNSRSQTSVRGGPGRVSSTHMAELTVDDEDLVVRLTLGEKIWSFHGNIRVRLSAIIRVAPDPKPWLGLRGWRMAGISLTGYAVLGTRRHGTGYDFCILHRDRPAVRVDVASGRFSRLIISVPEDGDPVAEAARVAAAVGITPTAPAS